MGCGNSTESNYQLIDDGNPRGSASGLFPWVLKRNLQQAKRDAGIQDHSIGDSGRNLLIHLHYYWIYTIYLQEKFQSFGHYLAHEGVAELLETYFKIFSRKLNDSPDKQLTSSDFKDMKLLLKVTVNYSQTSIPLTESMSKCGILKHLVEYLKMFQDTFKQNIQTQGIIVIHSVNTLYNCSLSSNNVQYYKELKAAEIILSYVNNAKDVSIDGDKSLSPMCLLILAHITDEGDKTETFQADDQVIDFLVNELDEALHRIDHYSKIGFPAKGLARSLSRLAMNDKNSEKILEKGTLKKLMQLIKKGDTAEQTRAVQCIWALSFVKKNKDLIKQEENVMRKLEELTTSRDKKLRNAASGALWTLKSEPITPRQDGEASTSTSQGQGGNGNGGSHVMLSYNWSHQAIIKEVKFHLEREGYNVWMDIDKMKGDLLEAMAEAVEQSAVVVIALSQSYKDSQNCRTEGEYAYKQKKTIVPLMLEKGFSPTGWLGAIIGMKLYYSIKRFSDVPSVIPKLVNELGNKGKMSGGETALQTYRPTAPSTGLALKRAFLTNSDLDDKPVRLWVIGDVQKWSKAVGIKQSIYRKLDGETLLFLKNLKSEAPEFFYRYVIDRFGMTEPRDLMIFCNALKELR